MKMTGKGKMGEAADGFAEMRKQKMAAKMKRAKKGKKPMSPKPGWGGY